MEDKCNEPDKISTADIFKNTQDLMKAMGADEKCVKASNTWGQEASTSGNFYAKGSVQAGYGAASAEAEAGGGFQDSSSSFQNIMNEAGCGTFVLNATKQSTNIRKIQCTIQKSQNQSEVGVSASNTVSIKTLPLSEKEAQLKAKLLSDINTNYAIIRPSIKDYKDLIIPGDVTSYREVSKIMLEDQKIYDESKASLMKAIESAYGRNLSMTNTGIKQTISGKIKIVNSLTANEIQSIESATKSIAKSVAEQEVAQKAGVNASSPNLKSITDTNIQTNEDVSSTAINSKVQSIKNKIEAGNLINIEIAGNINMENVKFDQNILLDVAVESIIASAIQAGVKAASEIISDSSSIQKIKTESKGLDDLVKAQGESKAAAIGAGKVGPFGSPPTFGLGSIILLGFLLVIGVNKYVLYGVLGIILLIIIISIGAFLKYFRKITGTETLEDKMALMKRSVDFYNKIWTSFGCTNKLTYDDIVFFNFENVPDNLLYETLESIFNKSLLPNASKINIERCFISGQVPTVFLPKIKLKKPIDLTELELKEIWTNYSKCESMTYFGAFLKDWNDHKKAVSDSQSTSNKIPFKYLSFSDVAVAIDKCGLNIIDTKSPQNLSEEDIKILWTKYGNCKQSPSTIKLSEYKKLATIKEVKDAIMLCKIDPKSV